MKTLQALFISLFLLTGYAQNLQTIFTDAEFSMLHELVNIAYNNDYALQEAMMAYDRATVEYSVEGSLVDSLSINAGIGASGHFYEQFAPTYNVSVKLDVINLIDNRDFGNVRLAEAKIQEARRATRQRVVEAFIRYKVAVQTAQVNALAIESSSALFQVSVDRYNVGESTLADQLQARTALAARAINSLSANGEVIVAMEALSQTVGTTPELVAEIVAPIAYANYQEVQEASPPPAVEPEPVVPAPAEQTAEEIEQRKQKFIAEVASLRLANAHNTQGE